MKLYLNSHVFLFFWRRKHTKNTMHIAEKTLRFVKIAILLLGVFSEIMSLISSFVQSLAEKTLNKTMHLAEKALTFCKNCRCIISGFHWNYVWNLTFCSILAIKTHKKHDAPTWKNRDVLWNLSFYYKLFSLELCLKSHVLFNFWWKTQKRNDAPSWKNRYVLWRLSLYYKRFSLKLCLNSHVFLFFWLWKHTKNKMHIAEKTLRFVKIAVLS